MCFPPHIWCGVVKLHSLELSQCCHQPVEDSGRWFNILIFLHQKKKRERRKGKSEDADEDDDEDHTLRLQKLSMQASDEEDEPGGTYFRLQPLRLISSQNSSDSDDLDVFPQSSSPAKEGRKRFGGRVGCFTVS